MTTLLAGLLIFLAGLFMFPLLLFVRARRSDAWDDSNLFNIYRVLFHLAIHPEDFGLMQYPDGKRPFHYINKDEYDTVVDSRP